MPYKRAKVNSKYVPKSAKLMDQVHEVLRYHHYAIRTEEAYVNWILKFIKFNGTRHPKEMGKKEIEQFLSHLAINRKVAVSTQNQAFNAILFLYKDVTTTKIYTHVMNKDFSGLKSPLLELENEKKYIVLL